MTEQELMEKLEALGPMDEKQRNAVVCALIGHSMIHETCFGYHYCARCGAQVGDTLGGYYPDAANAVVVGHNCETCRANYEKLTWKDKLFAPDPFVEEDTSD